MRGAQRAILGADTEAQALGVQPFSSSADFRDEIVLQGHYRKWLRLMCQGQTASRQSEDGR
jgi:hypothetical protein